MSKCSLTGTYLVFGLMTFVCTAAAAPPLTEAKRHCVVRLEAAGSEASQMPAPREPECYSTFRDAIFFATGGSVLLPSKQPFRVQLEILDQDLKARQEEMSATSTFVAAIDYEHINYGGSSLVWQISGPCTPSNWFYANGMPSSWWNDRVSSTRGYSDCGKNILFEHANRTGGSLTCWPNCSSVGWMNDRTSSREWHHICEGAFCGNGICEPSCGESTSTCPGDCPPPPPTCNAIASCANAGGGSVSCEGSAGTCFAIDDCYASCDGFYYYCPSPPGICPL